MRNIDAIMKIMYILVVGVLAAVLKSPSVCWAFVLIPFVEG